MKVSVMMNSDDKIKESRLTFVMLPPAPPREVPLVAAPPSEFERELLVTVDDPLTADEEAF